MGTKTNTAVAPTANPEVKDSYWQSRVAWKPPSVANLTVSPDAGKAFQAGKPVMVKVTVQGILTPLARNPMQMRVASWEEAWDKFCEENGISGTDHPKLIELAGPNG